MFGRARRPRGTRLVVDAGRVACPLRGDLDIDHCASCGHVVDLALDDEVSHVVCRPPRPSLISELTLPTGW